MIKFISSQEEVMLVREDINSLSFVSLDTETQGFDVFTKRLLTLQVGNKETQHVIDCTKVGITPLKEVLESKVCIGHNLKFDWRFLKHYTGIDIKYMYDTFLAECILTTGYDGEDRDLSLKALVLKYCGVDLDKSIRSKINSEGLTDRVIAYAAADIEYLEEIMHKQMVQINKWGLNRILGLENRACRVFAIMEYNGIAFNSGKLSNVAEELTKINKDITAKLDDIIVTNAKTNKSLVKYTQVQQDLFTDDIRRTMINWASPAQKAEILNKLGMKVTSVSDKILQKLKTSHEIVPLFIELSKYNKLESSFGAPLLEFVNPVTKRIHSTVWQILSTGRISMSEPNVQQIPAHSELGQTIKSCFVASEGYKIVSADYSGFELRIIAEFSQDPLWLKVFNEDKDLHSELCAVTFNIPVEDVKKPFPGKPDISYRFLQKTINFGLAYGMSKFKLSDVAQISVKEADVIIKSFFSKVPKVEKFLNMIADTAVKNGFIRTDPTTFRRIRWFPRLNRSDFASIGEVERAAKNTPPQGESQIVPCINSVNSVKAEMLILSHAL